MKNKRTLQLGGLCFMPAERPAVFFLSIARWVEAGKPNSAQIYDTAEALTIAGIPLIDAQIVNGLYVKIPKQPMVSVQESDLVLNDNYYSMPIKCKPQVKLNIIQHSNTKDHHKLNYGNSKPSANAKNLLATTEKKK